MAKSKSQSNKRAGPKRAAQPKKGKSSSHSRLVLKGRAKGPFSAEELRLRRKAVAKNLARDIEQGLRTASGNWHVLEGAHGKLHRDNAVSDKYHAAFGSRRRSAVGSRESRIPTYGSRAQVYRRQRVHTLGGLKRADLIRVAVLKSGKPTGQYRIKSLAASIAAQKRFATQMENPAFAAKWTANSKLVKTGGKAGKAMLMAENPGKRRKSSASRSRRSLAKAHSRSILKQHNEYIGHRLDRHKQRVYNKQSRSLSKLHARLTKHKHSSMGTSAAKSQSLSMSQRAKLIRRAKNAVRKQHKLNKTARAELSKSQDANKKVRQAKAAGEPVGKKKAVAKKRNMKAGRGANAAAAQVPVTEKAADVLQGPAKRGAKAAAKAGKEVKHEQSVENKTAPKGAKVKSKPAPKMSPEQQKEKSALDRAARAARRR